MVGLNGHINKRVTLNNKKNNVVIVILILFINIAFLRYYFREPSVYYRPGYVSELYYEATYDTFFVTFKIDGELTRQSIPLEVFTKLKVGEVYWCRIYNSKSLFLVTKIFV
jgi:hypothetical protein